MTKKDIKNALIAKRNELDVISMVTGIVKQRLIEITKGSDMTEIEFIILKTFA